MGSYYAEQVLRRLEPKVGLLNIGAEPSKGTDLQREAYALLTEAGKAGRIHFVGNMEAREAVYGEVDVIVSDGYSGQHLPQDHGGHRRLSWQSSSRPCSRRTCSPSWRRCWFPEACGTSRR
ncbi:MAG: hypothetical protein ACLRWQ_09415 [Flavonifractor plautii]